MRLAKFVAVVQRLATEAKEVLEWMSAETIQGHVTIQYREGETRSMIVAMDRIREVCFKDVQKLPAGLCSFW
jgi:hypothetical protein